MDHILKFASSGKDSTGFTVGENELEVYKHVIYYQKFSYHSQQEMREILIFV